MSKLKYHADDCNCIVNDSSDKYCNCGLVTQAKPREFWIKEIPLEKAPAEYQMYGWADGAAIKENYIHVIEASYAHELERELADEKKQMHKRDTEWAKLLHDKSALEARCEELKHLVAQTSYDPDATYRWVKDLEAKLKEAVEALELVQKFWFNSYERPGIACWACTCGGCGSKRRDDDGHELDCPVSKAKETLARITKCDKVAKGTV